MLCALAPSFALAAPFGVTVRATYADATEGTYQDSFSLSSGMCAAFPPDWPCTATALSDQGDTTATIEVSDGTSSTASDPYLPATSVSSYTFVSVSEGHVGISLGADASGIGIAETSARGDWNDTLTIGGLPDGTPVTIVATIGIDAQFVGLGWGDAHVQGCFNLAGAVFSQLCTQGGDGTGQQLMLPVGAMQQFDVHAGDTILLTGTASGDVAADNLVNDTGSVSSGWTLVATNSAHFAVTSPTPGAELTLASGCSITSGYGCDPVPEPSLSASLASSALALSGIARRRRTRSARRLARRGGATEPS
jgi:hypothetical protein